ncbi:MAG: hypothetical protein AABX65_02195 [Nanoarchaeota archaeon]
MDEELQKNVLKTGTSILGIVCKDGIVMAADRKVTAGNLVVNKDYEKVMKINDYLVMSWTGMVSDAQLLKKVISAELKLKELRTKERPTIKEAANLIGMLTYRNIRQFSTIPSIVGSLVAGFNEDGTFELYSVEPAGSANKVKDYDANFSSGMPFILGILEKEHKKDLSLKEGTALAVSCIKASSQRDSGSGHGIDIYLVNKDGIRKEVEQTAETIYK